MLKIIKDPEFIKQLAQTKVNDVLLAQVMRIYLANQRQGNQSALTRAEVERTNKKVYKQKHTGGARHGSRKAPIYVGGGIAFAPKPRDYSLNLNQKMKVLSKLHALAKQAQNEGIIVVEGMKQLKGKTFEFADFLQENGINYKKNLLVVTQGNLDNVNRAVRNITGAKLISFSQANALHFLQNSKIILMNEIADEWVNSQTESKNSSKEDKATVKTSLKADSKTVIKAVKKANNPISTKKV